MVLSRKAVYASISTISFRWWHAVADAVSALRMTSRFYRTEKLVDVADILFWSTDHCRLLECFFFLECHVSLALSEMICRMPLQLASCMFTFQKVKFVKPMHAEIGESPRLRIWDCALPNPAVYWHTVYQFIPSSFYTVRVRNVCLFVLYKCLWYVIN